MSNAARKQDDEFLASLGHNNPPDEMALLLDDLFLRNANAIERLGQLEAEVAEIDRKMEALQDERRAKRNEQRSIMQKAITKALQGAT